MPKRIKSHKPKLYTQTWKGKWQSAKWNFRNNRITRKMVKQYKVSPLKHGLPSELTESMWTNRKIVYAAGGTRSYQPFKGYQNAPVGVYKRIGKSSKLQLIGTLVKKK